MSTIALILFATFTAVDFARIRLDKAEPPLDAKDARASWEPWPGYNEPALARAIAALEVAVDESDGRALGDSAIEASIVKLDAIKAKLAGWLRDSLANREKLYDASGHGEVDVVNDLVKHGVNVNSNINKWRFESGWTLTPLQHAAKEGHPEVVRILLEAGAEKDCPAMDPTMVAPMVPPMVPAMYLAKVPAKDSRTPLWYAASGTLGDSLGVMRVLLKAKANTASACMNGLLPLHMAASKGHEAAVRMLLDFGADVDGSGAIPPSGNHKMDPSDQLGGKNQGSPLVDATGYNANLQVPLTLIEAGADPDLASSRGRSPLHNCAEWDYANIAQLLLEADANKDATDDDGQTPLFVAAQAGSTEIVRILIEAGARPYLGNNNGETPITVAKNKDIRMMLEMVPKVVVAITPFKGWWSHEVIVTSLDGDELMKLPIDSTLGELRAEVARKLGTDPPMVDVRLPDGDLAPPPSDAADMEVKLQDILA